MKFWQKSSTAPQERARPTHPHLVQMRKLANLLDAAFTVPGTKIKVGLDPVLGVVPGLGDGLTMLMSCYLIYLAHQWGLPRPILYRMFGNVAFDLLLGIIPVVGDVLDVFWRSNLRNLDLLEAAWHEHKPAGYYPDTGQDVGLAVIDVEARPLRGPV